MKNSAIILITITLTAITKRIKANEVLAVVVVIKETLPMTCLMFIKSKGKVKAIESNPVQTRQIITTIMILFVIHTTVMTTRMMTMITVLSHYHHNPSLMSIWCVMQMIIMTKTTATTIIAINTTKVKMTMMM